MDEIRPWLFIGNTHDTTDKSNLARSSIQAILQLAMDVDHPGITCLYLPVQDFAPLNFKLLNQGVRFVREQKRLGNRVLVACSAGINRSSSFCTAVLKEEEGLSLLDAFKEVKKKHVESMPIESVWVSLCNYYEEKTPHQDITSIY